MNACMLFVYSDALVYSVYQCIWDEYKRKVGDGHLYIYLQNTVYKTHSNILPLDQEMTSSSFMHVYLPQLHMLL